MKKIVSVFQRNYDGDRLIRDEVVPGAEWVLAGEGVATCKFDGTCCMVERGRLFKRHDMKRFAIVPAEWVACEDEPDPHTGHWPGWLPVGDGPEDQWFREAWANYLSGGAVPPDGTYELVGPKVQGNAEGIERHTLLPHGCEVHPCPRTFDGIREYLRHKDIEGLVFHHPDGRMAKVKKKDFGLPRKPA
jgi:hypothetical protein